MHLSFQINDAFSYKWIPIQKYIKIAKRNVFVRMKILVIKFFLNVSPFIPIKSLKSK